VTDPPDYRDPEPRTTRRWLRLLVIVSAIALLLLLVVKLVGGGEHGPARHSAAPLAVAVDGQAQATTATVSR
jgi:hypothetical protein